MNNKFAEISETTINTTAINTTAINTTAINTTAINTTVSEAVAYFTSELKNILEEVFKKAGNKIEFEQREEIEHDISHAIQLLENLKSKYA